MLQYRLGTVYSTFLWKQVFIIFPLAFVIELQSSFRVNEYKWVAINWTWTHYIQVAEHDEPHHSDRISIEIIFLITLTSFPFTCEECAFSQNLLQILNIYIYITWNDISLFA